MKKKMTIQEFLVKYHDVLSKSGLEVLTGINQKQLWHYSTGLSNPRDTTVEQFQKGIQKLVKELSDIKITK